MELPKKMVLCPQCKFPNAFSADALGNHLLVDHFKMLPWVCEKCFGEARFASESQLREHCEVGHRLSSNDYRVIHDPVDPFITKRIRNLEFVALLEANDPGLDVEFVALNAKSSHKFSFDSNLVKQEAFEQQPPLTRTPLHKTTGTQSRLAKKTMVRTPREVPAAEEEDRVNPAGEKRANQKCEDCGAKVADKMHSILSHANQHHRPQPLDIFRCSLDGRVFPASRSVQIHIAHAHGKECSGVMEMIDLEEIKETVLRCFPSAKIFFERD